MSAYSYADCLQKSYRVNWKISDVVGGRHFDAPAPLAAGRGCRAPTGSPA